LRWVELLTQSPSPVVPHEMLGDLEPGRIRKAWIDGWLEKDMSERTSQAHWARLFGFSPFLHDTPLDSLRALAGRYRAHRRRRDDLAAFRDLLGQ
jgi:hypothetical protein